MFFKKTQAPVESGRRQGSVVNTVVDTAQALVLTAAFEIAKRAAQWQLKRMAQALKPKPRSVMNQEFTNDNDSWWRGDGYRP